MRRVNHSYTNRLANIHWPITIVVCVLCAIGFAVLYSAARGNMDPWAGRHLTRFLFMIPVMILIALIDIQFWVRTAYWIYGSGVLLLIIVELIGVFGKGAQRWVSVGGTSIQPSEFMKIALVLALARYYHFVHISEVNRPIVLAAPLLLIAIPAALILHQPNLGTATITCLTGAAIMFLAGLSWRYITVAGVAVVSAIPVIWAGMHDYQKQRVFTFLSPESDPLGAGYNIMQSKIAIGSGGFFGKGFLEGSQGQLSFLPEKQTDFIFTMLTEEFGMVGGLGILILYSVLIFMGFRVALSSHNQFGRLVAGGISTVLFIHLFINCAMVMGLIPVVGVPLPFLSYGGSVLMAMMIGYGFVLNAYVYRNIGVFRGVRDLL
jgi:rod shape determining protein RodA